MSELTNKFQSIMKDIENNISNDKEREYVTKKIAELSSIYIELIENINTSINTKLANLEKIEISIQDKVSKIQTSIAGIENDIYEDNYDFEIVCPYCNNEFTADIDSKSDIRCPECQNIIELDWNGEDTPCSGNCSGCSSSCSESFSDDDYDFEQDEEDM